MSFKNSTAEKTTITRNTVDFEKKLETSMNQS